MTLPEPKSVFAAFEQTAKQWPERDFLEVMPETARIYEIEPGAISYEAALKRVLQYHKAFDRAGYQRGMRVAMLLQNRPIYFLIWLALNRLGVSVVPINPDLRITELTYLISHSEPALIITIASRQDELKRASKSVPLSVKVIGPNDPIEPPSSCGVVTKYKNEETQEAALLYTSGTTGKPKGCVLPNTYFLLAGDWYANVGGLASLSRKGERMITPLPMFHMNAMAYSFMAMVRIGGCLIALDRFHPDTWWADVSQSRATSLHYLGVMPTLLMSIKPCLEEKLHSVRFGFGAGIDPKLHRAFEKRFGIPLVEAWAMTETGAGAVIAASTTDRLIGQSCLGQPGQDIECKIIDEYGNDVPENMPGELLVRRSSGNPRYGFFSHYYKDPEATEEAWKDGWFHTGDMVRQEENRNVFFVDRKKNIIRRSGENIAALEVESVLLRHPAVSSVGVTSVPDPIRGEEVFAFIITGLPSKETAIEIMEWCLVEMAYYKAPGFVCFVNELPLTATQKIERTELKKNAVILLDEPNTITTAHLKKRQTI